MIAAPHAGFGLYIHWPFCQSKCPYCDFNSHVVSRIDQGRWKDAYLAEIERAGAETDGRILQSVFFGGGTPSLMDPELVSEILQKVSATWQFSNDPEITMEANPGSVEASRFAAYRQAGVNRVSIGVQALDDTSLRQLGRMHSVNEALAAIEVARIHFPRVNFDLIYARQGQDHPQWKAELALALSLEPTHLSLYQLTIEEGTVFHDRFKRGQLKGLPDEDLSVEMFLMTQEMCFAAGLPAYEVSNHAKPGEESRHNLTYWRGGDYVGIGPGAHGRLTLAGTRYATEAPKDPTGWLDLVERSGSGEAPRWLLRSSELASEYLMMGLRLKEGVSIDRFEALSGKTLSTARTNDLQAQGLVKLDGRYLKTTENGTLLLNAILGELLAGR